MPGQLKEYRINGLTLGVPEEYRDATVYEFFIPGRKEQKPERLQVSASDEPARANSFELVKEIMGRAQGFDPPLKTLRDEKTKVDGLDAYAWDYSIGGPGVYTCRRVVIDLEKRRYLSVVYTTQQGPADETERWKTIVASLHRPPGAAETGPPAGFKRWFLPEIVFDAPASLDKHDLFEFEAPVGASISIGFTLFERPLLAGVIADDADRPDAAARIIDRAAESRSMPDGSLVIDRYRLKDQTKPSGAQQVIRAKRTFLNVGMAIIQGRRVRGEQTIDADTVAVAESIHLQR